MIRAMLHRAAFPLAGWYWRLVKPKTFGVKAIVERDGMVLMIRNTYGDVGAWTLPGGGYRPETETPEQAAVRETKEELGLDVDNPQIIGTYETTAQGKRDTVTIVRCRTLTIDVTPSDEIAEARWMTRDEALSQATLATVARYALQLN